jgi:hypothetical protein
MPTGLRIVLCVEWVHENIGLLVAHHVVFFSNMLGGANGAGVAE